MNRAVMVVIMLFVLFSGGCQTVKHTAVGAVLPVKGFADDVYNVYQAVDRADKWFEENYW